MRRQPQGILLESIQRVQILYKVLVAVVLGGSCTLFGVYYYHNAILPKTDLGADQASHIYNGLVIYGDVLNRQWISVLFDSYHQVYWPFLHSWMLTASYLILGPTLAAGRVASLIPFLLSGFILAHLAWHACKEAPIIASITVAGLWWTAGAFALSFGTEAFIEPLAIMVTLLTFACLQSALERNSLRWFFACGVLAMCTYFAKTDYGLILLPALTASLLWIDAAWTQKRRILQAFGVPVVTLTGIWFAYLPKIPATLRALVNRPQGPARWSIAGVLYHPQQLMHWCDEPWLFALAVVCLILCLQFRRNTLWRAILIYVGVALLLHTISQTKDQKHIVKLLPWLFFCVAAQIARIYATLGKRNFGRWAQIAFVFALIALGWIRWRDSREAVSSYESTNLNAITASIADRAVEAGSSLVAGPFPMLSPDAVRCAILARDPKTIMFPPDQYKVSYQRMMNSIKRRLPFVTLLEGSREQTRLYELWEMPIKSKDDTGEAILKKILRARAPEAIFVIALDPISKWRDGDYKSYVYDGDLLLPFLDHYPSYARQDDLQFQGFTGHIVVYKRMERLPVQ